MIYWGKVHCMCLYNMYIVMFYAIRKFNMTAETCPSWFDIQFLKGFFVGFIWKFDIREPYQCGIRWTILRIQRVFDFNYSIFIWLKCKKAYPSEESTPWVYRHIKPITWQIHLSDQFFLPFIQWKNKVMADLTSTI